MTLHDEQAEAIALADGGVHAVLLSARRRVGTSPGFPVNVRGRVRVIAGVGTIQEVSKSWIGQWGVRDMPRASPRRYAAYFTGSALSSWYSRFARAFFVERTIACTFNGSASASSRDMPRSRRA